MTCINKCLPLSSLHSPVCEDTACSTHLPATMTLCVNILEIFQIGQRMCVSTCMHLLTSEEGEPLQAYLDHVERFLGLVQGDGLSALLLNV